MFFLVRRHGRRIEEEEDDFMNSIVIFSGCFSIDLILSSFRSFEFTVWYVNVN